MLLPRSLLNHLAKKALPEHIQTAVDQATPKLNSAGFDRWGLEPLHLKAAFASIWPLYKYYFRVRTHGRHHIPQGRVMLIANHSGQIPLDAALISMALLDQTSHPRICRSMVENWVPTLPFISDLFSRCGQMVGEPHNCLDLLQNEQCLLVFPEGMNGIAKNYRNRYQLQKFGSGFARLASEAHAPIIPVGVIGCEETYPAIARWKGASRFANVPYMPITPTFPWLGALGAIPFPAPVDIYFGKPIYLKSHKDLDDAGAAALSDSIKATVQETINLGLAQREGHFFQHRLASPSKNKFSEKGVQ